MIFSILQVIPSCVRIIVKKRYIILRYFNLIYQFISQNNRIKCLHKFLR